MSRAERGIQHPELIDVRLPDGRISHLRHYPRAGVARILFCHGTGLASDAFARFWGSLLHRYDVVVMDLRGHGWNSGSAETVVIDDLVSDLAAVVGALRSSLVPAPMVGLFHSIAAMAGLRVAIDDGDAFQSLVLYEPSFFPEVDVDDRCTTMTASVVRSTRQRRNHFASPAELADRMARSPITNMLSAEALTQLAEALLIAGDGGWKLRCTPDIEAGLYASNHDLGLWRRCAPMHLPVLLQTGGLPAAPENYSGSVARSVAERWSFDLAAAGPPSHLGWLAQPHFWAAITDDYLRLALPDGAQATGP